ncbi:MAG TPA: anti-sigma factor [Saprospiraceae bacterium]|nr:anti-sigma factor [Saprospiraceae bacterium]
MNIQEYIASGVLESYLLGELSPQEQAEVEKNAAEYPEIRAELDQIELALEQFAVMSGTPPPAGTLTEVLQRVSGPGGGTNFNANRGWLWGLAILSVVTAGLAYNFYSNHQNAIQERNQLQSDLQTLAEDCNEKDEQLTELSNIIDILSDPATRAARMQGTELAPQAIAQVFVNENTQQVFLDAGNLPTPPADKSYQLWGLVDGNPVDMGVFELNTAGGLQAVPFVEGAQTYAITLEEAGGQPTPDLTQLYVIGNVS